jgi:hypothetical protein
LKIKLLNIQNGTLIAGACFHGVLP